VPLWLKNNSATMVCPFLCVVMIPSGFRGGVGVLFFSVNRSLLSLGVKKGFPVIGKSLLAVGCLVLLCGCGGLRLFSRSVFPRFDTVILPLLFNIFSAVGSGIFPVVGAALFLFRFFDFLPHFFDFLLCRLCKLCQFVLKFADMVEVYPDMLNGVSRPLLVALMHFNPADKLVENGGGEFGKVGVSFCQLHKPLRPSSRVFKSGQLLFDFRKLRFQCIVFF